MTAAVMAAAGCAGSKKPDPAEKSLLEMEGQTSERSRKEASSDDQTGSIYRQGGSSLFSANKASRPGDILTVTISEEA
ncbi:MAG: flagellar basal body L-ring protein FlgH, partial [Desulfosalsimonas sp.]